MLIYIHKELELAEVERRQPAVHYVLIDDKTRILAAVKKVWGARITTVFPKQGHYALQATAAEMASVDIAVDSIGALLDYDLPALKQRR